MFLINVVSYQQVSAQVHYKCSKYDDMKDVSDLSTNGPAMGGSHLVRGKLVHMIHRSSATDKYNYCGIHSSDQINLQCLIKNSINIHLVQKTTVGDTCGQQLQNRRYNRSRLESREHHQQPKQLGKQTPTTSSSSRSSRSL